MELITYIPYENIDFFGKYYIYTETYDLECCFKISKHIVHFVLMYTKLSFKVNEHHFNFLSINLVKLNNTL